MPSAGNVRFVFWWFFSALKAAEELKLLHLRCLGGGVCKVGFLICVGLLL